jgi:hypothetical protein
MSQFTSDFVFLERALATVNADLSPAFAKHLRQAHSFHSGPEIRGPGPRYTPAKRAEDTNYFPAEQYLKRIRGRNGWSSP